MEHKDVYREQLDARLESLSDPKTAQAVVKFMDNFRKAAYLVTDSDGNQSKPWNSNHVNGFLNTIIPNVIPTLMDVQVDFLPNNVVENLAEDVRKVKEVLDAMASQKPPKSPRRPKVGKASVDTLGSEEGGEGDQEASN